MNRIARLIAASCVASASLLAVGALAQAAVADPAPETRELRTPETRELGTDTRELGLPT